MTYIDSDDAKGRGATALVPWDTIERIVSLRDAALAKYEDAYAALSTACDAINEANAAARDAAPKVNSYNHHSDPAHRNFLCKLKLAGEEDFRAAARRLTDIGVWAHIVEMTELETVMDKEEKDKLRDALHEDPPEVTADNVYATLQRFVEDADTIWRRGLANCFSKLDRRFRSHTGWKIGSRVILDYAFDSYGMWNYHRNLQDTLHDVERAFFLLDGRHPPPHYSGIVQAIVEARRNGNLQPRQTTVETEFFRVRIYKNGNCHIWLRRDDLVEKANKTLAEYYGESLVDGTDDRRRDAKDADLFSTSRTVARNFGHFPTPDAAAETLIGAASLYRRPDDPALSVLEPSAGAGNLARRAADEGAVVDCVELQGHLAGQLRASGRFRRIDQADFLTVRPRPVYDRVIMNPPFDMERDIDHVMHALDFLKPDGILTAIMSAGTEWRETKKARAFRDRM
ncbi:MAG: DUF4942 domain-containing protein, partial [Acidobacteria bacterium]|nr:DUF4942 domain-containing protein [Acidobacteriota bacterium]